MSEENSNDGKRDYWQVTPNSEKGVLGCPKMKGAIPGRDVDKGFCLEHCVREPNTQDLCACNPVI